MRRILRTLAAAAALTLTVTTLSVPAQAYENYNMDNSWAKSSGTVWRDDNRSIGFNLALTDDNLDGKCVYYQYQGVRNDAPDTGWSRLTTNVCGKGTTKYYRDDSKRVIPYYSLTVNEFRVRACKAINNAPDTCTAASYVATRGKYNKG